MNTKRTVIAILAAVTLEITGVDTFGQQEVDLKKKCCEECLAGANRDVRAMDIGGTDCLYYQNSRTVNDQGEPIEILSTDCIAYFEKNPTTVYECR